MTTMTLDPVREGALPVQGVSLSRVIGVELRKMFDTRAGAWLMASVVIAGVLSTIATVTLAPDADLTYYTFAKAIGFPMTVILPIIAVLAITSEWSQRTGLTTFTLVPRRPRVVLAKVVASVVVGAAAMLVALVLGVVGNVAGPAVRGTDQVWDVSVVHALDIVLGSLVSLLLGTVLGILFRSSSVALVAYFVIAFLLPTVLGLLAANQAAFRDLQEWVDLNYAQAFLFEGTAGGAEWARLAVATTLWLVLPAMLGLRLVMRSEIK
jgi:ABC-type transport system involved in multi-copper enzyme maturation permease subunit